MLLCEVENLREMGLHEAHEKEGVTEIQDHLLLRLFPLRAYYLSRKRIHLAKISAFLSGSLLYLVVIGSNLVRIIFVPYCLITDE